MLSQNGIIVRVVIKVIRVRFWYAMTVSDRSGTDVISHGQGHTLGSGSGQAGAILGVRWAHTGGQGGVVLKFGVWSGLRPRLRGAAGSCLGSYQVESDWREGALALRGEGALALRGEGALALRGPRSG